MCGSIKKETSASDEDLSVEFVAPPGLEKEGAYYFHPSCCMICLMFF